MRLTVVIPSLNEAQGIQATLRRLPRDALEAKGWSTDVVVVDGASTDGTADRAAEGGATVVVEPRKGYGRAYKTGFAAAPGDVVVTADADDTYPLDALPRYLDVFRERRLDFATLDRFAGMAPRSMALTNRFGNAVLSLTGRLLYGVRVRDSQSGMWILSRRALERIPFDSFSDGMPFSQELKIAAFRDPQLRAAELSGRYYLRVGEEKLLRWQDGLGNLRALWLRRLRGR